jgi:hypothetical protein
MAETDWWDTPGGLTGVILASPPLDFAVSDTYFLVAHFHYILFGTVVFTMFGGFYFWWPNARCVAGLEDVWIARMDASLGRAPAEAPPQANLHDSGT